MQNTKYTLKNIAKTLKIDVSLVRFWCEEFKIKPIVQNKKGNVQFSEKSYQKILEIYRLIEKENHTLEEAQTRLIANTEKKDENAKTIQKLEEIKQFFLFLKTKLD